MSLYRRSKSPRTSQQTNSRRLRLECLENKNLLAGDVATSFDGVNLVLTGDLNDNSFRIIRNGAAVGAVTVEGLAGTTIDTMGAMDFTVTGDIVINFSDGGDNSVTVGENPIPQPDPIQLAGNVSLTGGAGTDSLLFTNASVDGNVSVDDLAGGLFSFLTTLESTVIGGDLTMDSAAGKPELSIDDSTVDGSVTMVGNSVSNESFLVVSSSAVGGDIRHFTESITSVTQLESVDVGDDVIVDGQGGEDRVIIQQASGSTVATTIGDDLRIITRGGDDEVTLSSIDVGDDLQYRGGDGNDLFLMESADVTNIIGDDLYASAGDGVDDIGINDVEIGDKLRVSMGAGDEEEREFLAIGTTTVGSSALISLGTGLNDAAVEETHAGRSLTIVGRGTNDIFLFDVTSTHFVTIITSSGEDDVSMNAVNTHSALVSTHAGNDTVSISDDSIFDYLFVLLGSGDDTLTLDGVTVERFAVFSGGSGCGDELIDTGDNDINFAIDFAFETVTV